MTERNENFDAQLNALVAGAPETNAPKSQTVAEALVEVERRWAAELNRQAEAAAEQVRTEYAAKHVAEKAELQRQLEEVRLAKERKIREEQEETPVG